MSLAKAVTGVLLPPLSVFLDQGLSKGFVINLLLTIFTLWTCGIIHAFHAMNVDISINVLCLLLPPLGALLSKNWIAFLVCLLLTLLGWLPGVIFAYYCALEEGKEL